MTLIQILTLMQEDYLHRPIGQTDEGWVVWSGLLNRPIAEAQALWLLQNGFIAYGNTQPNGEQLYFLTGKGQTTKPDQVMFV